MPDVIQQYGGKPFDDAVSFFRQKVNLPTKHWDDLWEGMHARAFVVAGAMKSDLLIDLRKAVDKALTDGETLADFRKRFDGIVERHGWSYKGQRNWRTRVIYETNFRTAYAAGRYQQMTDPDVVKLRPYWMYRHGDSKNPRLAHLALDGKILPHDDPFWSSYYPPNGWGCRCRVVTLSQRDLEKMGKKGPDKSPEIQYETIEDDVTGKQHKVPVGIDPGWNYNVGEASLGKRLSESAMEKWRESKADAWETLVPGNWESYGRPEYLALSKPIANVEHASPRTQEAMHQAIVDAIGGEERILSFGSEGFTHEVYVHAEVLSRHVDVNRTPYIPLLAESLTDPSEIWLTFARHKGTGQVVLRQRFLKCLDVGKKKGLLIVTNAVDGIMEAWTVIPVKSWSQINKQRSGKLLYSGKE